MNAWNQIFKPSRIVNYKLEKIEKGSSGLDFPVNSIQIKCITCLEVLGKVEPKCFYSTLFSCNNPEDIIKNSTEEIDITHITLSSQKLQVKSKVPVKHKDSSLLTLVREMDEDSGMQQIRNEFYNSPFYAN